MCYKFNLSPHFEWTRWVWTLCTRFVTAEEVADGFERQVGDVLELLHQILLESQDVGKELHQPELGLLAHPDTTRRTQRYLTLSLHSHTHIYISGIFQTLLSKATYKEYICWKRDSNISLWYIKIRVEQVSSIYRCEVNRTSFIIASLYNSWDKSRRDILSALPTSKNIQYAKQC